MEALEHDWAWLSRVHFGGAELGDSRRSERLMKTGELILKRPGGSLPEKLPDWADLMGLYRLVRAKAVTHAAVIAPHLRHTLELMRGTDVVLLPHDTTELDYTDHEHVASELSHIGNGGGRGYLCHNTLAVTPERKVLGLAGQILHQRRKVPKNETAKQKREHPDRESLLWPRGCEAVGPAPAGRLWVDVCDRGSDGFEFLEYEHTHGRHYVIRANKDRKLHGKTGPDGKTLSLYAFARGMPALGTKEVDVAASTKKGAKARKATVAIAAGPLSLPAPKQPRGKVTAKSLDLWVVHAREVSPPAGVTPLEWVLLTNVPAEGFQQAAERVAWYSCRPVIEDYHRGMKSGMGIELPQFESPQRLEPVIGLLSVSAAVLLQLRHMARDPEAEHTPATAVVPELWTVLVAARAYRKPDKKLTVQEFFVGVAKLGGHLARKNDGPPGWITLWRGWRDLHMMVQGAQAMIEANARPKADARCV
jgi:hypothetical protein